MTKEELFILLKQYLTIETSVENNYVGGKKITTTLYFDNEELDKSVDWFSIEDQY